MHTENQMSSDTTQKTTTPPLLSGGEMDSKHILRVSRKRNSKATLRTAYKLIERHDRVDIRTMGAAVVLGIQLANQLVEESQGTLQSHVRTYSVPVNVQLPSGHVTGAGAAETKEAQQEQIRYNSALSIVVSKVLVTG